MKQELHDALQALANQYNVKLAVVETPELPASESATFEPQAAVPTPVTPAPTTDTPAPTDQPIV